MEVVGEGVMGHGRIWEIEIGSYIEAVRIYAVLPVWRVCGRLAGLVTYRLGGSSVFRDLAFATGSNDFTASVGVVGLNEPADSSSLRSSERDRAGAGAWSEL